MQNKKHTQRCGAARFLGWRLVQVNHANVRTVKDVRQAVRRQARFTLTFEQPERSDVTKPAMRRRSTRRDSVSAATAAAAALPNKGITSRENSFGRRIPSTVHSPTPPISSPASPTLPASKKFSTFSARPPSSRSATPVQALANDRSRSADPSAVGRRTASTEKTPKTRADKRSSSVGRRSVSGRGSPPPPVYLPEPQVVVPPAYQELVGVARELAGQPAAEEEDLPNLLRQFAVEKEEERAGLQRELENQRAMFALQLEEKDERVRQLEKDGAERLKIDMESSFKKILDPSIDEVLMTMRSALSQNSPATPPAGAAIVAAGGAGAAAATAAAVEGSHDTSSSATAGTPLGLLPSSTLDTHLTRCCDALAALTDVHNLEWKEWTPPPVPPPVASADAKASYLLGGLRGLHVELCSQNQTNIAHAVGAVLSASTRNLQATASGAGGGGGGPNGVSPAPATPNSAAPSAQRATSPARAHSPKAHRLSGTSMSMPMPVMPVLPLRRQGSLSQEQERYLSDRRSAPRETDIRQSSFARGAAAGAASDGVVVVGGTSTEDARLEQLFDMRNRLQQFLELKPQQLHERAQQAKREAQEKGPQAVHKVVAELDEYHSGERRGYEGIMGELENEQGLSSPTQTTLEPLRKGWRDLEGQEAKLLSTVQKLQREYTDTKAVAVAVRHKLEEVRNNPLSFSPPLLSSRTQF